MSRIDDAVLRILRVKYAMGLFDEGRSQLADRGLHGRFGSPEHRDVARRAVRQSLVLLKNERRALPLSKSARRIHVAGKNADDIGNQCGGWTIKWQGQSGPVTTGGTTILAALKAAAGPGTQVTFARDGAGAAGRGRGAWSWWARRRTPRCGGTARTSPWPRRTWPPSRTRRRRASPWWWWWSRGGR